MINGKKYIKESSYTVKGISEAIKCSRSTLYNNKILISYIEKSSKDTIMDNPYNELEKMKQKNTLLEEKIALMNQRDVLNENLKLEIELLNNRLNNQEKTIDILRNRNLELSKQIQKSKLRNIS